MKSAYSFLVLKLSSESLLLSDIDVVLLKGEIKKNWLKPFKISVSLKCLQRGSRETAWVQVFFFSLGNLLLCDRKYESYQNRVNPTQAISSLGAVGKTSSLTAPNISVYFVFLYVFR